MSKMQRNLDGVYFRVQRDGRWQNVCYSDMTPDDRDEIARKRAENATPEEQAAWWRSIADVLADQLYDIGEQLGVKCADRACAIHCEVVPTDDGRSCHHVYSWR